MRLWGWDLEPPGNPWRWDSQTFPASGDPCIKVGKFLWPLTSETQTRHTSCFGFLFIWGQKAKERRHVWGLGPAAESPCFIINCLRCGFIRARRVLLSFWGPLLQEMIFVDLVFVISSCFPWHHFSVVDALENDSFVVQQEFPNSSVLFSRVSWCSTIFHIEKTLAATTVWFL